MELKVFTLPTCQKCPAAKRMAREIAQKYGIRCREVDMSTPDGQLDGLMHHIMSTPSIAVNQEVIARGKLLSRQALEAEVRKRLDR